MNIRCVFIFALSIAVSNAGVISDYSSGGFKHGEELGYGSSGWGQESVGASFVDKTIGTWSSDISSISPKSSVGHLLETQPVANYESVHPVDLGETDISLPVVRTVASVKTGSVEVVPPSSYKSVEQVKFQKPDYSAVRSVVKSIQQKGEELYSSYSVTPIVQRASSYSSVAVEQPASVEVVTEAQTNYDYVPTESEQTYEGDLSSAAPAIEAVTSYIHNIQDSIEGTDNSNNIVGASSSYESVEQVQFQQPDYTVMDSVTQSSYESSNYQSTQQGTEETYASYSVSPIVQKSSSYSSVEQSTSVEVVTVAQTNYDYVPTESAQTYQADLSSAAPAIEAVTSYESVQSVPVYQQDSTAIQPDTSYEYSVPINVPITQNIAVNPKTYIEQPDSREVVSVTEAVTVSATEQVAEQYEKDISVIATTQSVELPVQPVTETAFEVEAEVAITTQRTIQ